MKRFLFFILLILMPLTATAVKNPFVPATEHILSFFKPLEAEVLRVEDKRVWINAGEKQGVKRGMRLKVFERGAPFHHPVTGEYMGRIERFRGIIQVEEVEGTESICSMVEGDAHKDDLVRISGAQTRMLFYQDLSVDYFVGDGLYQELRKTERFDIADAPIEKLSLEKLLELARKEKADFILKLNKLPQEEHTLRLTLLWADGREFYSEDLTVDDEFVRQARSSQEFLTGGIEEPLLLYSLPFGAEHICTGDVDGDKKLDIIMSNGYEIYVYSYDVDLSYLYQSSLTKTEDALWLDLADIDGDGKDEIIVSAITDSEDQVISHIYRVVDRDLKEIWQTQGFLRAYQGKLLWQDFSPFEGYTGRVSEVLYKKGTFQWGDTLNLPPDINIYNFVKVRTGDGELYLYVDRDNHLVLLNRENLPVWRSEEDLGGFLRSFEKKKYIQMVERGRWSVPDRMIVRGRTVIVPARTPLAKKAKTLGYKESELRAYSVTEFSVDSVKLISDISGTLFDFSSFDDKIAFINKPPLGVVPKNLLRGKNPFIIYLQIFSMK